MIRRRVFVSGRVQGVFFRDACARQASLLGAHGGVRNLYDGRLEAWFEGDETAVERMVEWCRVGPPRADVTGVDVRVEEPTGERGFRVG